MSNPVEDFIISLGFDTSKVKGQIQALHKELETLAVSIDRGRVRQGLSTEREITQNTVGEVKRRTKKKLSDEQLVESVLQKNHKKAIQRQQEIASLNAAASGRSAFIESARRQQSVRALLYPEANPQLKAMGSYYRKLQADQSDMGNKSERSRKRSKMSLITNSAAFRQLSNSDDPMMRSQAAKFLMQARKQVNQGKFTGIAGIKSDIQEYVKSLKQVNVQKAKTVEHDAHITAFQKTQAAIAKKQAKAEAMKPNKSGVVNALQGYQASGLMSRNSGFDQAIITGAMKQSTQKQAEAYIKASMRAAEYSNKGVGSKKDTMRIISEGNVQVLSKANMQLASMNAKMAAVERRAIGTAAAFGGMHDSARNMVREMASVYAVMAATSSINQTGQTFEGLNSAMLAATGNSADAAQQMQFMIDLSKRLGLSVKDITDQYIKFKFAASGKLDTEQIEDIYTSTAELGTVLGLSQEKMKLTFTSMSQMMSKTTVMSEELKGQMSESFPGKCNYYTCPFIQ